MTEENKENLEVNVELTVVTIIIIFFMIFFVHEGYSDKDDLWAMIENLLAGMFLGFFTGIIPAGIGLLVLSPILISVFSFFSDTFNKNDFRKKTDEKSMEDLTHNNSSQNRISTVSLDYLSLHVEKVTKKIEGSNLEFFEFAIAGKLKPSILSAKFLTVFRQL